MYVLAKSVYVPGVPLDWIVWIALVFLGVIVCVVCSGVVAIVVALVIWLKRQLTKRDRPQPDKLRSTAGRLVDIAITLVLILLISAVLLAVGLTSLLRFVR